MMKAFLYTLVFVLLAHVVLSQTDKQALIRGSIDTIIVNKAAKTLADTSKKLPGDTLKARPKHSPRIATRRSLILPGWGQAYNREYWKIPLVYGALSIPTTLFFYNNSWYKKTKKAYEIRVAADTLRYAEIDRKLEPLSVGSLQTYRNTFRRDRDYAVLYLLLAWGLNIVDATVFAHLKDFDVSNDLSMHIQPTIGPNATSGGLSLVVATKTPARRKILLP